MTAAAWAFAALAVLLSGPVGRRPASGPSRVRAQRPALSCRSLQLLSAGSVTVASVLAFGPITGAVTAGVAAPATAVAIGWAHGRQPRPRPDPQLALCLDLVAVALRAGQPLPAALTLAAPAGGPHAAHLIRVAGLLRLGASPDQAWAAVSDHPLLGPVATAGRRSAESGIRLAGAFEQRSAEIRDELRSAAQARAHRIEVLVAAPLGLCFLPSFVCLGIIPIIIGIAGSVLGG